MFTRIIRHLSLKNPIFSFISILVSVLGLVGLFIVFQKPLQAFMKNPEDWILQAQTVGVFLLVFIVIRSIFGDLEYIIDREKKAVVGTGIEHSRYAFRKFLDAKSEKLFLIGQNLRTPFSDQRNIEHLEKIIKKNKSLRLTLIMTTIDALMAISPHPEDETKTEYIQTLNELRDFLDRLTKDERKRIRIHFHRGASSLSMAIRDPDSEKRGELVFQPKWSTEMEPHNRVFCAIRHWEHPEIFKKYTGYLTILTGIQALSFEATCEQLGVRTDAKDAV